MVNRRVLTPFERDLWMVQSAAPESTPYNLCMAFELRGSLDEQALAAAVDSVVARHAALRSVFPTVAGSPWCVVADAASASALPAAIPVEGGSQERARILLDHWTGEPFDLARGPLFRARLIRLAAEHHVLVVGVHHIVADGASMEIIWEEILSAYEAGAGGSGPPVDHQESLLPADVHAPLPGDDGGELERYWAKRLVPLGSGRPLSLEVGAPPAGEPTVAEMSCGLDTGEKCRELAREERTSVFVVVLTAFMIFLYRWAEPSPVVVATPVDVRLDPSAERNVGLHINLLPVIAVINRTDPFRAVVRRTRNAFLKDLSYAALPFGKIAELAGGRQAPDCHALAQATFQMVAGHWTADCTGLEISPFLLSPAALARYPPAARRRTAADFAIQVWMRGDVVLSGTLRTSAHISQNAAALAADFSRTVSDLLSAPDVALGELDGLGSRGNGPLRHGALD